MIDPKIGFVSSLFPHDDHNPWTRILTRFGLFVSVNIDYISSNPMIIASVFLEKCVRVAFDNCPALVVQALWTNEDYRNAGAISRTMWKDSSSSK
jgi:hypothetical protein